MLDLFLIDRSGRKVLHRSIHIVIIIRIILENVDLIRESAPESLSEVHIRFMRIERPVWIRSIQEPFVPVLLGDDIDNTSDSVCSETHRYHTLIDLYTLGIIHRNVIQSERTADTFLRNPIDKDLDMLAGKSIHHQLHIRADTAGLSDLHSGRLSQGFTQVLGWILQGFRIEGHGIERRTLEPGHAIRNDNHLIQLRSLRADYHIHLCPFPTHQFHGFLYRLISDSRYY